MSLKSKNKAKSYMAGNDSVIIISDSDDSDSAPPKSKKAKITKKIIKKELSSKKCKIKVEKKPKASTTSFQLKFSWTDEQLLSEKEEIDINLAQSIINLFDLGHSIPFITRYRSHYTNELCSDRLRQVRNAYEEILDLKLKAQNAVKHIEKSGNFSYDLQESISKCKSLSELEHIYAPYKPAGKKTLAERAKQLGLESPALALLYGSEEVNLDALVENLKPEGIRNLEEAEASLIHLLAYFIYRDAEVVEFLRSIQTETNFTISSKQSTYFDQPENIHKFEQYFFFTLPINCIKPHQILALNRGENLKILKVQIDIPIYTFSSIKFFCEQKWLKNTPTSALRKRLFQAALEDGYKRLVKPLIRRQIRSELTKKAETASIEVFAKNLKRLLLTAPLKGKVIMGIDPGFQQGCKIGMISENGSVLDVGMIYPHTKKSEEDVTLVKSLLQKHGCSTIALGNGKACRETERWLTNLIKLKTFHPLEVKYTIVDESGASFYSCSDEAKSEFPTLNPLFISAISLARRVQDPISELVKVDPKNLGVGMYQHDINAKHLENTLNEVVSECVSFIGVDLNTTSLCLLKRVAGLTEQKAKSILQHRETSGPFTNRFQLKNIKGIGEKTFEQCAGFLRISPNNSEEAKIFFDKSGTNPLDATWIHPESYDITDKLINLFDLSYKEVGQKEFIDKFKNAMTKYEITDLAKMFKTSESSIKLIVDVLSRPLDYDLRQENRQEPLFKTSITTMQDLKIGVCLTGRVNNVIHFGAFVDIGVGQNGLIHTSCMHKQNVQLGDIVEVAVKSLDLNRMRIGLDLKKIL